MKEPVLLSKPPKRVGCKAEIHLGRIQSNASHNEDFMLTVNLPGGQIQVYLNAVKFANFISGRHCELTKEDVELGPRVSKLAKPPKSLSIDVKELPKAIQKEEAWQLYRGEFNIKKKPKLHAYVREWCISNKVGKAVAYFNYSQTAITLHVVAV